MSELFTAPPGTAQRLQDHYENKVGVIHTQHVCQCDHTFVFEREGDGSSPQNVICPCCTLHFQVPAMHPEYVAIFKDFPTR